MNRNESLGLISYTSLYPNSEMPQHGLFVEQRLRRIVATGKVHATVVAPVPWFPSRSKRFGYYARLARVARSERRGDIDVLHPRYPTIPKFGMGVQSRLLSMATKSVVEQVRATRGGTVIDAHYFYPDGVAAAEIGCALGMPVTITARGSDVNTIAEFPGPRSLILAAARQCAAVIAVSDALRARLVAIGVPADRITVLRNGVDLDFYSPGLHAEERRDLGVEEHAILSVGRLVSSKGHALVVDALRRLPSSNLYIAGEGPENDSLRQQAFESGVLDRIRFLGSISPDKLVRYYRAVDVLVLASEAEGMPNVVLEAMACGTPVIASNVGGIPEVLHPTLGRLLAERSADAIANAVEELLTSPPDRDAVRAWAEQFSWDDTVAKSVALFERVAATS